MRLIADILFSLFAYAVTVGGFLAWIFLRKPDGIPRTRQTVVGVCLRTALVVGFIALLCAGINVPVYKGILFLGILALLTLGSLGLEGAPGLIVFYVIQQWILGWPDKEDMIHTTSLDSRADRTRKPDPLQGQPAVTLTPLKPGGKIRLEDGAEVEARCETGFLDAGRDVTIVGKEAFTYVVRH